MAEYIERDAASADSDRNKIKTPFARIVVEGTPGKPYYNIWYFDPANGECHIGFGSYCLDNVFNWFAEEFEITEPYADIAPVVHGRWVAQCVVETDGGWTLEDAPYNEYQHSNPICSICRKTALLDGGEDYVASPYCPNCGARMDGDDDG